MTGRFYCVQKQRMKLLFLRWINDLLFVAAGFTRRLVDTTLLVVKQFEKKSGI